MAVGSSWLRKIFSRRVAVAVLITLATIVMLVGSLNVWTKRQLLDTDEWVETSSQLLENDHIRHAISIRITEAAFERADLASYLPEQAARLAPLVRGTLEQYAVQAADNFLQRPRVQELWRTANREAHEAFLRVIDDESPLVSTQGDEVVLDLQPIVLDFAADRGIEDAVASRLPEGAGQFTIMKADQLEAVQNLVNLVRKASALLALIAIGLYGLAIWLARDRRRQAVRSTFISLLFVGVIVLVARKLAGDALIEALAEGDAAETVGDQTWLIATSLMVDLAYALIILGVVGLVCTWLLGMTRPAVAVRRMLAPSLRHHPALAYGALAFLYLLVILWGPTGSRRLLGIVILAALLFGTLELLRRRCAREFPEAVPDAQPPPPAPTADVPTV